MKKVLCIVLVSLLAVSATAINYPTYHPSTPRFHYSEAPIKMETGSVIVTLTDEARTGGGFSSISTTPSLNPDGTATRPGRGRTYDYTPATCTGYVDNDYDDVCDLCGGTENQHSQNNNTQGGTPQDHVDEGRLPLGSPILPLVILALGYAAVVYCRSRRKEAQE